MSHILNHKQRKKEGEQYVWIWRVLWASRPRLLLSTQRISQASFSLALLPSREERITRLEEYLKGLQAEAKALEERLAEMKAGG